MGIGYGIVTCDSTAALTECFRVSPRQTLLYVLRDTLELHGPKFGCGLAQCGSCTVLVDGKAVRSCATPVSRVAGRRVTTLEGLGTVETKVDELHKLHGARCGEPHDRHAHDPDGRHD